MLNKHTLCSNINIIRINIKINTNQCLNKIKNLRLKSNSLSEPISSIRNYATEVNNDKFDKNILNIIHSYPKSINATPYEILNIDLKDKNKINSNDLKKYFFKLAKIYHPDSISYHGYPLDNFYTNNKSLLLNNEIKIERFKKILSAYNLLKNPISKSNYDNYNIGWNDSTNLRTNPNMYNPSSNEYKYYYNNNYNFNNKSNFTSYETGTWEDRYKYGHETAYGFYNDNSWSSSKTGDLKEEFLKNKKTIFLSFLLTISIYTALQLSHLYLYDDLIGENYNKSLDSSNVDIHQKSEDDLFHAYTNYGLGDSKQDRINRFLWWRKFTMTFSLADVTEVLDNFYKRGVIENNSDDETKLKQFDYKHK